MKGDVLLRIENLVKQFDVQAWCIWPNECSRSRLGRS